MWIPKKYEITDRNQIRQFIQSVGLGTIISFDTNFPIATHTPIEIETNGNGKEVLRGHIAKANPQSTLLLTEPNVLAIFLSPVNHYVSSSWYEKPNAPTWNYMSVHIYGRVSILTEEDLWNSVDRLTQRHEMVSKCPISLQNLPKSIQGMLKRVTGFEISIDKVEAAFKLSQNRNEKDYQNIIEELKSLNTAHSILMSNILSQKNKSR